MKLLSILTFVSAFLTVYFDYFDRRFVYLFKPLTLVLIIALVWFCGAAKGFYKGMILTGLIFSLVGDALLIDSRHFVSGLASFLIAHLFYAAAFWKAQSGKFNPLALSTFLIGAGMLLLIYDGVPAGLKIPVIFYALAISLMLCLAFNLYLKKKTPESLFAASGAFLFVASDSLLAYNKFGEEYALAKLLILSTYFAAQWLIARSVSG